MHLERLTLDELTEEARNHGYAHLSEVKIGVLEPDGKFSFLTTGAGRRPTPLTRDG